MSDLFDDYGYRVWCPHHKDWEQHKYFLCPQGKLWHYQYNNTGQRLVPMNGHILERRMNKMDKNATRFHAGDIVETESMLICREEPEHCTRMEKYESEDGSVSTYWYITVYGIVRYNGDNFYIDEIGDNHSSSFYDPMGAKFSWDDLTIIGDIHHDKKLIEDITADILEKKSK